MPPYVELHCHSAYSFLDGVSLPHELARRAGELGHTALALTDHNSVSGSMEMAQAVADVGVRAIHGAEIDLADGRHLTLLVRDERGWSNLCRIITHAHAHTRERASGRERTEPSVDVREVIDRAEGLVRSAGPVRGAAAPVRPPRSRSQPRAGRARQTFGGRVRGHRQRTRARARQGRVAGRVRGAPPPRHA
jgi:DNA polymerase III alpha subunit